MGPDIYTFRNRNGRTTSKQAHLTILTFPASDSTCRANKQVLERRIGTATFGVDR
jgi:hypothetical protein